VASLVAASSSSAAANMVMWLTLIAAENLVSAFVTRRRSDVAVRSHCCVVCVFSMMFDEPSLSEATTLVCRNPPYSDSAESVRRSIEPFGPPGPQPLDNKFRPWCNRPARAGP
jgi:hypothetical protein